MHYLKVGSTDLTNIFLTNINLDCGLRNTNWTILLFWRSCCRRRCVNLILPNNYNPLLLVRNRIFSVQIEMLLLVACKMFFQLISRSFISDLEVSLASTTLANEPDKYGETIAVVFELTKRTQEMLFADWAQ